MAGKDEFTTAKSGFRYLRHREYSWWWYVYRTFRHRDGTTSSHRLGLIEEITKGRVLIVGAQEEFGSFFSRKDAATHLYLRMPEDHPARKEHGRPYRPRLRKRKDCHEVAGGSHPGWRGDRRRTAGQA